MPSISVDAIFQRLITDAKNYDPTISVTKGSDTYIRFAATASAIWGLYKQADWTLDQIFPETMSAESLERWAIARGLNYQGLTPAELLILVIERLRNPPSGGKASDFERWTMSVTSQGKAFTLLPGMISGDFSGLTAANLVNPHNMDSIGFSTASGDAGKSLVIDLSVPASIFGVGLGTPTSRRATFSISSADALDGAWTPRGTLNAKFWWEMTTFEPVEAQYWKITLDTIADLDPFQDPEWNRFLCSGIELYTDATFSERASSAKCLANHYGVGTVMMLLSPHSLSMRYCEAVRAKCEEEGPIAPKEIYVNVPVTTTISVRVTLTGTINDLAGFRNDVARYFIDLIPGSLFIPAQITVFAIKYGAINAEIEISVNGGTYVPANDALTSANTEQFLMGDLIIV
jgi:hypothetical protein